MSAETRADGRRLTAAGRQSIAKHAQDRFTTHGLSYSPEYRVWQQMCRRCTVPTHAAYADYGGRGITVCDRWLDSVEAFVADIGLKPTPKHEIDRRENDLGYWCGHCAQCVQLGRPSNCRWVTRSTNDRNRRNNLLLSFREETLSVVEWAERVGIDSETLRRRVKKYGYTAEEALTTPVRVGGWASRRSSR